MNSSGGSCHSSVCGKTSYPPSPPPSPYPGPTPSQVNLAPHRPCPPAFLTQSPHCSDSEFSAQQTAAVNSPPQLPAQTEFIRQLIPAPRYRGLLHYFYTSYDPLISPKLTSSLVGCGGVGIMQINC